CFKRLSLCQFADSASKLCQQRLRLLKMKVCNHPKGASLRMSESSTALVDGEDAVGELGEKSGTITNSYGDIQLVNKAGDKAGVRTDFELIVRLSGKKGEPGKKLVPLWPG